MTEFDATLVRRAEQAILGALLAGHDPSAMMPSLHPQHFTDPAHQALYVAITRPDDGGITERLWSRLGRLASGRARRTAAYAAELRSVCPDPGHRWVYAAMLLEANEARHPEPEAGPRRADPNQRLASAGEWLASAGASGTRRRGADQNGPVDRRTRQLARALRPAVQALVQEGRAALVKTADDGPVAEGNKAPGDRRMGREDLQDAVLADLMRRPGDGKALVRQVPAQVFSPGPRRELYAFLQKAIAAGVPVDPLITAWQANKREPGPPGQPQPDGIEPLTTLAIRLSQMATTRGTAAILGRVLLADHECTQAFGPGWTAQPLTWNTAPPEPAGQPPPPGTTPGPARPAPAFRPRQQAPAVAPIVPRPRQDGDAGPLPRQP